MDDIFGDLHRTMKAVELLEMCEDSRVPTVKWTAVYVECRSAKLLMFQAIRSNLNYCKALDTRVYQQMCWHTWRR